MPNSPGPKADGDDAQPAADSKRSGKLGLVSGVFIPVFLNIMSILMFLRFGLILFKVGFLGIIGLLALAYSVNLLTALSLSAIASNGEVKGGGAYYLISRSLGPEFGGSIGILFYLAQALNTAMNIVGLIDCIRLNVGPEFPQGYWAGYGLQTAALVLCTCLSLLGSGTFSKASNALLFILCFAVLTIPVSAIFRTPFSDMEMGVSFTGVSFETFVENTFLNDIPPVSVFREQFGILFPATSGIFAGASMSGDLRNPSKAIPKGTLWAMLTTFIVYFTVIFFMAASTSRGSFYDHPNIISQVSLSPPVILAGECAVTFFSALMGIIGSAKLFQALARDKLLPGLFIFGKGTKKADEPIVAIVLTYAIAQVALLADLNQIATLISMGYQMTFFVMNLACFLLKIGSAPNFRPGFQSFSWQTALLGSLLSAGAMFFIEETYAAIAISVLIAVFLLIHYLCPPKRWGDVSQNLIYHQVRKYLLRLKPEHIKFWRPHIILLINNPRRQARLIQFCNSLKKGSLYILGHVIVTDDFNAGVHEARLQQQAWTNYISEFSRIKAFVQLTMSPSITWGIRNLILSAGLGGMRPNIAVIGFYNMDDLRKSNSDVHVPGLPMSTASKMARPPTAEEKAPKKRRRGDTSARLLEGFLPTDVIRTESALSPTEYMTMLEDLALKYRLNVGVAYGFDKLETPRHDGTNSKKYIDLWPIQMSAEVTTEGKNVVTTNFDTYTLILQLGHILHSVQTWRRVYALRVMVFVEYESEVEEETARVKALLDKLRIDAEVLVFWLASGNLKTYEHVINGSTSDVDAQIIVSEALRDEGWWDELQTFRGQMGGMSASQEMSQIAHILDSTSGRPNLYNPHEENGTERRRSCVAAELAEMPKKPDITMLSKLGVSVGIHTHHLNDEVFDEASGDEITDSEGESSETDGEVMPFMTPHPPTPYPFAPGQQGHQPAVPNSIRRRGRAQKKSSAESSPRTAREDDSLTSALPSYGTMSTSDTLQPEMTAVAPPAVSRIPEVSETVASPPEDTETKEPSPFDHSDQTSKFPSLAPLSIPPFNPQEGGAAQPTRRSRSMSPTRKTVAVTPVRPVMSRQSSAVKFSSRPVPETTVTGEDSRIAFAPQTPTAQQSRSARETPRAERPTHSRQSSLGKFSSRPVPETKVNVGEGGARTITFAEQPVYHPPSGPSTRHHSRQGSQFSYFGDAVLDIPDIQDSYKAGFQTPDGGGSIGDAGSAYSTQSVALSFNDLPSRAQHLILNELMRQQSGDTAVLLSTLPIPSEGTCADDPQTVQYLSDVELLCHELPPTIMVLSNNMTVTVSL